MEDITNKASQNKTFSSNNFPITKIFVAIRLAEDGTRMSGIYFKHTLVMAEYSSFKVEKLANENYHIRKFNMKMCLTGKDLQEIVTGAEN